MVTGSLATWSDLPPELLEEVLIYLDPRSLLTLGKLNHYLNHLALETFFGYSLYHIHRKMLVPPFPHDEDLLLSGFYLALWLNHVTELEQSIYGDVYQSIRQFRKLISFVKRLHSMKSLKLRILISPPCWGWRDYRVEGEKLIAELHELVDVAMTKGCETLQIEGNSLPHCRLSASGIRALRSPDPVTVRMWKWMKGRMSLPCISTPLEFSSSPTSQDAKRLSSASITSDSHITDCVLSRPALLGARALPYIAKLLRRNAETITHLEMNCFGLTRSWWKARALSLALFDGIHLPHLSKLILHIQVSTISTGSFAWFLSRHPEITTLEIHDPSTLPDETSIILTRHQPPFSLPNLRSLRVPARVAEWLLAKMTNPSIDLQSLEIYARRYPDGLAKLGDAIRELRHRKGRIQILTLDANWWKYGNELMEEDKDDLGKQDDSSTLRVHRVVFAFQYSPFWMSTCPMRLSGGLTHVMRLFPMVKELEMRSNNSSMEIFEGAGEVKKKIMEHCPTLCVLSVQC
ncbi:hypothetical protein D9756_003006 [Leucocoprinus leucothites]|uniref:F-box domain-containing protein n=1 Tax=Leucocoprinus leucothites TaxID=201217 RepID=A0A8H5G7S7_9AGAR|nr:hypothetical protein D9756_003006 [Leucoagaricus leucothites]